MKTFGLEEAAEFVGLHPHTLEAKARAGEGRSTWFKDMPTLRRVLSPAMLKILRVQGYNLRYKKTK